MCKINPHDEEERQVYEIRLQALAEVESKIASAMEKGLEKGLEKGRMEGADHAKKTIALNMLDMGIDVVVIAATTGLAPEAIEALRPNGH